MLAGALEEHVGALVAGAADRPVRLAVEDDDAVGERIWTLTRLFNVREGISRADDELPPALRVAQDSVEADSGDGSDAAGGIDPERFDAMLDAYYRRRGWGPDGRPTRETVERLDLEGTVDDETPLATTSYD